MNHSIFIKSIFYLKPKGEHCISANGLESNAPNTLSDLTSSRISSLIISGQIKFDLRFKDSISGQLHTKPNECIREEFSQFLKHSIFIPNKGKNLFNFRQKRKCFKKMALFIWMEKYVSICVIAWVIVPLQTC